MKTRGNKVTVTSTPKNKEKSKGDTKTKKKSETTSKAERKTKKKSETTSKAERKTKNKSETTSKAGRKTVKKKQGIRKAEKKTKKKNLSTKPVKRARKLTKQKTPSKFEEEDLKQPHRHLEDGQTIQNILREAAKDTQNILEKIIATTEQKISENKDEIPKKQSPVASKTTCDSNSTNPAPELKRKPECESNVLEEAAQATPKKGAVYHFRKRKIPGYTDEGEIKKKKVQAVKQTKRKQYLKPKEEYHPAYKYSLRAAQEMEFLNSIQDKGLENVVTLYDIIDAVVDYKFGLKRSLTSSDIVETEDETVTVGAGASSNVGLLDPTSSSQSLMEELIGPEYMPPEACNPESDITDIASHQKERNRIRAIFNERMLTTNTTTSSESTTTTSNQNSMISSFSSISCKEDITKLSTEELFKRMEERMNILVGEYEEQQAVEDDTQ